MKKLTLLIPDLFLPKQLAAQMDTEVLVPTLEKLLGHGRKQSLPDITLEDFLCEKFAVPCVNGAPLAPLSAAFDGLERGCWLRADPVHLDLQRDQLRLSGVEVSSADAVMFCASLNAHFAGQGLTFFAPHAQRWYIKLDKLPDMRTMPLSQVLGSNVLGALPVGDDALHWHQLFNEIQMLLFTHPLNQAREAHGELTVNSVWLWGAGCSDSAAALHSPYHSVGSDEALVEILSAAAKIPFLKATAQWIDMDGETRLLLWAGLRTALQRGDLSAWHGALQEFETNCVVPIWQALRNGSLTQLEIIVLAGANSCSIMLNKTATWSFWRRSKKLSGHSVV